jgi:Sec-independent protein translocase protein TatA
MGFGTEVLFALVLGLLVLGPKRLHTLLVHAARAKAELQNTALGMKAQLSEELEAASGKTNSPQAPEGNL